MNIEKLSKSLQRMNINEQRTDVENLMLRQVIESDRYDILRESTELDLLIPDDQVKLFGNEDIGEDMEYSIDPSMLKSEDIF